MILEAWKYAGKKFFTALLIGYSLGLALTAFTKLSAPTLFKASTMGVRNVSIPMMQKAASSGIDPLFIIFIFNSTAALMFASFLFMSRLFDPEKIDTFPSALRKLLLKDPTIRLLAPLPGYRAIKDDKLRPLFACLMVAPLTGVLALGLLVGVMLVSSARLFGSHPSYMILPLAYTLPHGIFEIPGLLLGSAIPISAYLKIRTDLENGQIHSVFDEIRGLTTAKKTFAALSVAFLMLIAAAIVEIHLTDIVGAWFETLTKF